MARIKIKDLPKDKKVSKEELKKIFGGTTLTYSTQTNKLSGIGSWVQWDPNVMPPTWKPYSY